ncbi:MAG TPA: hypothetical protein VMR45_00820 [Patescibacteria group bacterium]|nr:hypothetical protein [Patescibacteria group bacterium]
MLIHPDIPYVISADVAGLMGRWAEANGLAVPSDSYFKELSLALGEKIIATTGYFVEVVPEAEMRQGMEDMIVSSKNPVISLDRAYIEEDNPNVAGFIDSTRAISQRTDRSGVRRFSGVTGLSARPGHPSVEQQIEALRTDEIYPVTLADDVIFNGDGATDIASRLKAVNRPVEKIVAGIGIAAGVAKLNTAGIEVECLRVYDSVADEVCERDFIAGVPMSGRTVIGQRNHHWSAPYFRPYGDPESWASIPAENCQELSRFCLAQSVSLWREVELASGREIGCTEVPRTLYGAEGRVSIVELLQQDFVKL